TLNNHAAGFSGTPSLGHFFSAAINASLSASSAPAMSCERAAMKASSGPYESRAMAAIAACAVALLVARADLLQPASEVCQHETNIHSGECRGRMARRPFQGNIEARHIYHYEPA